MKKATVRKARPKVKDNRQVLRDQMATQAAVENIHDTHRTLDEWEFYPAHDKRKESSAYAATHKKLCITLNRPCMVCGVKNSTLKDPNKNRYDARAMETHHHIVEWALANAIDADQFNKVLRPNLARRHPQNPLYQKPMTLDDIKAWVDHSEDNLWVLCDVHHRHKYLGIHAISYPIWCPQDLLQPGFSDYVRAHTMGAAADSKPARAGKGKPARPAGKKPARAGKGKPARPAGKKSARAGKGRKGG